MGKVRREMNAKTVANELSDRFSSRQIIDGMDTES
jgi:hypothetical protein